MDTDAVSQLTEHLCEALRQLRGGQRPGPQELDQLQRDVEVVRAQIRSQPGAAGDLVERLREIDSIAVEASRHGSAESLALELIRMKLDPVFKKGSREQGIAALKEKENAPRRHEEH